MNVFLQENYRPDYVTLTFNAGTAGEVIVKLDNLELNKDVEVFAQWWPEVFNSAGGIATKIARRQPLRLKLTLRIAHKRTICKWNEIVRQTSTNYTLRACFKGYWQCWKMLGTIVTGGDPQTGGGTEPTNRDGVTIQLGPGGAGTGLLGAGAAESVNDGPEVGDTIEIGGQQVEVTPEVLLSLGAQGVVIVPLCFTAIVKYDQDVMYQGQGRGLGVNANTYTVLEILESAILPIPITGTLNDPQTDDGTGTGTN